MSRRSAPQPPPPQSLPIRTRCVVGTGGVRSLALMVFCPPRAATIAVDVCERCTRLSHVDARAERPHVECDAAPAEESRHALAGTLTRSAVLCVRRDAPLDVLAADENEARVIPVVDDEERYVGVIVRGRSNPPPSVRDFARAPGMALTTAEDQMEYLTAVNERDGVVAAASTMTSSRARCVPVVNDAHTVVGLLDDVALLGAIARAHRASEVMKRCSCGMVYTREQWTVLPLVGRMPGQRHETVELRNCAGCGSTMAVPYGPACNVA